jgi:hypothetical protein
MRCVHRIPRPTLVTIAKRPSGGHGTREDYHTFLENGNRILAAGAERSEVSELSAGISFRGEASSRKTEH